MFLKFLHSHTKMEIAVRKSDINSIFISQDYKNGLKTKKTFNLKISVKPSEDTYIIYKTDFKEDAVRRYKEILEEIELDK